MARMLTGTPLYLISALLSFYTSKAVLAQEVFEQSTTSPYILSIEAESHHANIAQGNHTWGLGTTAGSSNSSVVVSPNIGTLLNSPSDYLPNSSRLDYEVNFSQSGQHYVWARVWAATASDDSFHIGLNGEAVDSSDRMERIGSLGQWTWTQMTKDGVRSTMDIPSAGRHQLNLWFREDGIEIDKLVFTTNATYDPSTENSGFGPDESNTTPGSGGGNLAPVALDDTATTDEDIAVTIAVLTNDSDPDGDLLTITAVTQGNNGSVSFTGSDVTYTPNAGFSGTDTFNYTIEDGNGGSDSATVSMTIVAQAGNTAPTLTVMSPVDGSQISTSNTVTFSGIANDNEEGDLSSNISWTSSLNGLLGTGAMVNTSLSEGTHTITATVTDSGSLAGTDIITMTVTTLNTSTSDRITAYTYTTLGLVETIDGPRTDVIDVTTLTYDTSANLTHVTNALGHVSQITDHDESGRPLTLEDANGAITTLAYDARGRLKSQDVAGNLTQYSYDLTGNVKTVSLANGEVITYHYDSAHRPTGYSDALGNKVTYTLDDAGNITKEDITDNTQTLTRTHQYIYDELNRLRSDIGADTQTATFDYDVNNNLTDQTDPKSNPTNFAFDALDRLTGTTDAATGLTTYTYDDRDNLTSVTDANGHTTSYTYNSFDEVILQNSPDTGITTYTYDEAGNRLSQTDARGITTNYSYDALNRLLSVSYPDSSLNISYGYDDNTSGQNGIGRLTSQTDATGTTTYSYDLRGNVISMTSTLGGNNFTTSYDYNTADQLIKVTYPDSQTVDYQYDLAGRLNQVDTTDNLGNTQTLLSAMAYQPFGPLTDQTYGNGLVMSQVSDLDYRQASLTTAGVLERNYGFDLNSNINSIVDNITSGSQTLDYDSLDRLDNANDNNVLYGDIDYQYDAVHNRTAKNTVLNSLSDNESYQYDPDSNIVVSKTEGITTPYHYDANGNMIDNGVYQFSYGDNNRLMTVRQGSQVIATYHYNAQGQRTQKVTQLGTTYYLYGLNGELLVEANTAGTITKHYIFANGQLLAQLAGGNTYYVHNDHLGTPQVLTDSSQQIVWQAAYTPFGEATVVVNTVENNIRFPGQYFDQETNLHYNYFRYYDPTLGRYITSDPIGLAGGINTYGYVGGNPISYYDPDGLLLTAIHASRKGLSRQQAMQVGRAGNTALLAGAIVGTATVSAPAAGVVSQQVLKKVGMAGPAGTVMRELIKGIDDSAIPGPKPPGQQPSSPPQICGKPNPIKIPKIGEIFKWPK